LGEAPGFAVRSDVVREAHRLAAEAHEGQLRKDNGSPYITHPVAVAGLLDAAGYDDEVIAAALLHDVVEDTDMAPDEIAERFGKRVARLVEALSDDDTIHDYQARKREHSDQVAGAGGDAIAIYIADKLSNLCDMRRIYAKEGEEIASRFKTPLDQRIGLWREDLEMARREGAELPYLADFERELDAFDRQREAGRAA
jgi:(p)ppGpp synthase/HD superfamily hydrolase